jgi:hypothetical protein
MTVEQGPEDCSKSLDEDPSEHGAPSPSKRTLLRAAWVAPVVVAVTLPRSGYAANVSGAHGAGQAKGNNGNHFGWFKKGS